MRIKFDTIEDIKTAIENNDKTLGNKSAFDLEIEFDKKLSDVDMTKVYNELYADNNIRLVLIKNDEGFLPKSKFEVKMLNKVFYINPQFIENSVGLVYVLRMKYHFEALKRLVNIANSLDISNTKIEFYAGKPTIHVFEDEKRKLWNNGIRYGIDSAGGLEMHYLSDIEITIAEEIISKKEFIEWLNADFA